MASAHGKGAHSIPMAGEERSLCAPGTLRLLVVVGRILRQHSRFLSPGVHTLYNALLSCVGRIYEYDRTVTPWIM